MIGVDSFAKTGINNNNNKKALSRRLRLRWRSLKNSEYKFVMVAKYNFSLKLILKILFDSFGLFLGDKPSLFDEF